MIDFVKHGVVPAPQMPDVPIKEDEEMTMRHG